jgi:adenine/guanine/hypoxanthine permease
MRLEPGERIGLVARTLSCVRAMLASRGTTLGREVLAGLTTFAAMSYIVVVNPAILAPTGMDRDALLLATTLSAAAGTLLMALWANLPIALAPGMGSNVVFAQVLVGQMGVPWQTGLAMVALNALIFFLLSLSRWRAALIDAFPEPIKLGMQYSIGAFIAYLGLHNGGLVAFGASIASGTASPAAPGLILSLCGIALTLLLLALRIPCALLLSILVLTVAGRFMHDGQGRPLTVLPPHLFSTPPHTSSLLFAFDFQWLFAHFARLAPIMLYFLLTEFFAGASTLLGVSRRAGLLTRHGGLPNPTAAFGSDAVASMIGSALGTTTVTVYIESVTGVEAGGRTGVVGIVVALLFLLTLFCAPLIATVPIQATSPILLVVGFLMLEGMRKIELRAALESWPPLLMLVATVCTGDLMSSLALGVFAYSTLAVLKRAWHRLTPMVLMLDALFATYLALKEFLP